VIPALTSPANAFAADRLPFQLVSLDLPLHNYPGATDLIITILGKGTGGKVRPLTPQDMSGVGGPVLNVIPSTMMGACTPLLIAFCFDGDNFNTRFKEISDHAGIACPGTHEVVIFTSQWKPTDWKKYHEATFHNLKPRVTIILTAFDAFYRLT
jgi:hypothetical protein